MPFAKDGGAVTSLLKQLVKGQQAVIERSAQGGRLVDVVVRAGQNRCTAGGADRVGAETVVETHAALGDAVEVGRAVDAAAVGADGMAGMVIRHDEKNIGLRRAQFASKKYGDGPLTIESLRKRNGDACFINRLGTALCKE